MIPDCPVTETLIPDCHDCNGYPSNSIVDWKKMMNISSDIDIMTYDVMTSSHDVGQLYDLMNYMIYNGNVFDRP